MAIKSDRWIREMSENHGMIEPYAENQVRLDENGQKLISYGVSSYGYDVRCAREFKVFTNVHSVIVDPKNFDDKSFIDIEADVVTSEDIQAVVKKILSDNNLIEAVLLPKE